MSTRYSMVDASSSCETRRFIDHRVPSTRQFSAKNCRVALLGLGLGLRLELGLGSVSVYRVRVRFEVTVSH